MSAPSRSWVLCNVPLPPLAWVPQESLQDVSFLAVKQQEFLESIKFMCWKQTTNSSTMHKLIDCLPFKRWGSFLSLTSDALRLCFESFDFVWDRGDFGLSESSNDHLGVTGPPTTALHGMCIHSYTSLRCKKDSKKYFLSDFVEISIALGTRCADLSDVIDTISSYLRTIYNEWATVQSFLTDSLFWDKNPAEAAGFLSQNKESVRKDCIFTFFVLISKPA